MEYQEFMDQIMAAVRKKCGGKIRVSVSRVMKNNRSPVDTLTLLRQGGNLSPTFYVEKLYEQYQNGSALEKIADHIVTFAQGQEHDGRADFSFFADFAKVREHINCRLVNAEKNRAMLSGVPHRRYLDLAVVYQCQVDGALLGGDSSIRGSILIQNAHLAAWKVDLEELHETAVANTLRRLPYDLIDLEDMLREITGSRPARSEPDQSPIYVLTNTERWYGAVNMMFDHVLEEIGEKLKADYYILPSSVHECMIVPETGKLCAGELCRMVHEINAEYVAEEEILGESVYRYSRRSHMLILDETWQGEKDTKKAAEGCP